MDVLILGHGDESNLPRQLSVPVFRDLVMMNKVTYLATVDVTDVDWWLHCPTQYDLIIDTLGFDKRHINVSHDLYSEVREYKPIVVSGCKLLLKRGGILCGCAAH
jgi:hypothetical protein